MVLYWDVTPGDEYRIYQFVNGILVLRGVTSGGFFDLADQASGDFVVRAVNAGGEGESSNLITYTAESLRTLTRPYSVVGIEDDHAVELVFYNDIPAEGDPIGLIALTDLLILPSSPDQLDGFIENPTEKAYTLILASHVDLTFVGISLEVTAGSLKAELLHNGQQVPLTIPDVANPLGTKVVALVDVGITKLSALSEEQIAVGERLELVLSSISTDAVNLSFICAFSRSFQ